MVGETGFLGHPGRRENIAHTVLGQVRNFKIPFFDQPLQKGIDPSQGYAQRLGKIPLTRRHPGIVDDFEQFEGSDVLEVHRWGMTAVCDFSPSARTQKDTYAGGG